MSPHEKGPTRFSETFPHFPLCLDPFSLFLCPKRKELVLEDEKVHVWCRLNDFWSLMLAECPLKRSSWLTTMHITLS